MCNIVIGQEVDVVSSPMLQYVCIEYVLGLGLGCDVRVGRARPCPSVSVRAPPPLSPELIFLVNTWAVVGYPRSRSPQGDDGGGTQAG